MYGIVISNHTLRMFVLK